ncbi:MAG: protein-export chaperone SecB [Thiohalomonadales bacterium]
MADQEKDTDPDKDTDSDRDTGTDTAVATQRPEESAQNNGQQFNIQKIFLKDSSLESPNAPEIFTEKWEPNVNIELNSNGRNLGDSVHEVVLGVTVTAKIGDKTAYLVEVQQSGIFSLNGFSQQDIGLMLGSYCPNLLYPYAREVVSDLVLKSGFPQMILAPVNFDAIYQDHLKRQQQEAKDSGAIH